MIDTPQCSLTKKDLPKVLQSLPWRKAKEGQQWADGQEVLAALPMRDRTQADRGWWYHIQALTIVIREPIDPGEDDAYYELLLDGEYPGYELDAIDLYVGLDDASEN